MKRKIKAGTTSHIEQIVIDDSSSTTGAGLTGLLYNSAGMAAKYKRVGASTWTTITLATATAGTYTSGGFIESDSGAGGGYELHPPNAAIATGVAGCIVEIYGGTNMAPVRIEYELDAVDYQDGVRAGLTALPESAPNAANGMLISVSGGLDMDAMNTAAVRLTAARAQVLDDWINGGRLDVLLDAIPTTAMRGTDGANTVVPDNTTIAANAAAIAALNDLSAAEVATELATYDGPTNTEMVAAFTEIKGATWATTDTLEAIRDRGDAAWITAAVDFTATDRAKLDTLHDTRIPGIIQPQTGDSFARIGVAGAGLSDITINAASVTAILTTQMTEAYSADGVAPTLAQAIYEINQGLTEFDIVGTTITTRKLDGTTAAMTHTLDSATTPTSRTRAT